MQGSQSEMVGNCASHRHNSANKRNTAAAKKSPLVSIANGKGSPATTVSDSIGAAAPSGLLLILPLPFPRDMGAR